MKRILVVMIAAAALAGCSKPQPKHDTEAIDKLLQSAVAEKKIPGVIAMVVSGDEVAYDNAIGMNKDAILAMASMTKPVTSVAVMQLVEAGKVKLDEPAGTYLPELAKVQVLDGGKLRPPKSPMTVRQLLTHTSGFVYEFMNPDEHAYMAKGNVPSMMAGSDGYLKAPLLFDPGTRWEYGISTDWLGKLVEKVSGESLEDYFRHKIFDPLGMPDSYFIVPADKQARVASVYQRKPDGSLEKQPQQPIKATGFFSGGGGLYSTVPDYIKFSRALMAGGQLGQTRILSADSVAAMHKNQIGDLTLTPFHSLIPQMAADNAALPGGLDKFGLGFAVNALPGPGGRGAFSMAWAGIFNTFFWIDPEKKVCAVLATQMLPGLDPGPRSTLDEFERAVYASMGK